MVTEDGQLLTQSLAIMEYLEERYSDQGKRLLPRDPLLRARVREVSEAINAGTQPIQNLSVLKAVREKQEDRAEWARAWIEKGLRAVEQLMSKQVRK